MTAIVMKCIQAEKHPNADSLRSYVFSCAKGEVRIVANMENIYHVGDNANIVLANCMLNDESGTKIRVGKIRGIRSHGMALGKTDLPVNTDVTDQFCEAEDEFKDWPSIDALSTVRKDLKSTSSLKKIIYRGKVKLDGTNAGVMISSDGSVVTQSRNRIITPEEDNCGFAKWVKSNEIIFNRCSNDNNITIFGEWCGSGIQSNSAAVANIGRKVFSIFAVQIESGALPFPLNASIVYEPEQIKEVLSKDLLDHEDVFVLPWCTDSIELDFTNSDMLKKQAEQVNQVVRNIEQCDPWVKENFDIEGVGEGVVMYPITSGKDIKREDFCELVFKAKGEKHKVSRQKEPAQIDPEVAASIEEFVEIMVTENRLNQISQGMDFDVKLTGKFVKAFMADVQKESRAELEESSLEWKQVAKAVSNAARNWWMDKIKEL